MFPVPSYASEAFLLEVARWYRAVGEAVAGKIHPAGPVVMAQVDNEAPFYFRTGAYDQDYHPDALQRWSAFTAENTSLGQVDAPTRFDADDASDLPRHLEWARFQETLITSSIARMASDLRAAGFDGIPLMHNLPPGDSSAGVHLPNLQKEVDLVGLDFYHPAGHFETIKRRALYLAGNVDTPFAPELGAGAPYWFTPLSHDDSLFCAQAASAYGLRGMNLYMAVDRDRWYGAPIDNGGEKTQGADDWARFFEALKSCDFHRLQRKPAVALIVPREYVRLSRVSHRLGIVNTSFLEMLGHKAFDACDSATFGFEDCVQTRWWNDLAKVARALDDARVPYDYVDGEADPRRLDAYETIFHPTFDFIDRARVDSIKRSLQQGKNVCVGPRVPALDSGMQPLDLQEPLDVATLSLEDESELETWARSIAKTSAPPFEADAPIEITVHFKGKTPKIVFAINPSESDVITTLRLPAKRKLTDLMTEESFENSEADEILMPARSCRMFSITTAKRPSARAKSALKKSPRGNS